MKNTILIVAATAFLLTGCGNTPQAAVVQDDFIEEVADAEVGDCDVDDMIERDTDCGFAKKSKKKTAKATSTKSNYKSTKSSYKSSRSSSRSRSKR